MVVQLLLNNGQVFLEEIKSKVDMSLVPPSLNFNAMLLWVLWTHAIKEVSFRTKIMFTISMIALVMLVVFVIKWEMGSNKAKK